MQAGLTQSRPFQPGTRGWSAADLDEPDIERQWFSGSYEIVEGVLTTLPPAYFIGGEILQRLIYFVISHSALSRATVPFREFPQLAIEQFMEEGGYERHLRKVTAIYRRQVERMSELMDRAFPRRNAHHPPPGGFLL